MRFAFFRPNDIGVSFGLLGTHSDGSRSARPCEIFSATKNFIESASTEILVAASRLSWEWGVGWDTLRKTHWGLCLQKSQWVLNCEHMEQFRDGASESGSAEFFSRKISVTSSCRKCDGSSFVLKYNYIGLSDSGSLHAWGACGGSSILPSPTGRRS